MASLQKTGAASSSREFQEPSKQLPSTKLALGIGPLFQSAWANHSHGENLKKISDPAAQGERHRNNIIMEGLTLNDLRDKKSIDGSGGLALDDGQAIRSDSSPGLNQQEMERRRLNRIISNRLSAKRSRARKNQYVAELERQAKYLENKIGILHPQVVAYEKQRHLLLIEQHQVKLRMAILEKERVLKEAETEKMKAEMFRLIELQRKKEQLKSEVMRSWGADMKLMCNPNPDPCDSEPMVVDTSSAQEEAKIGEPSEMQIDSSASKQRNRGKGKGKGKGKAIA